MFSVFLFCIIYIWYILTYVVIFWLNQGIIKRILVVPFTFSKIFRVIFISTKWWLVFNYDCIRILIFKILISQIYSTLYTTSRVIDFLELRSDSIYWIKIVCLLHIRRVSTFTCHNLSINHIIKVKHIIIGIVINIFFWLLFFFLFFFLFLFFF